MIPWTSINLVDFYFLKHGEYDIDAIFDINGKYGKFNTKALVTYFATFAIEIPFANCLFYEGPIAKSLGDADIAWVIGLGFSVGVYYFWSANSAVSKATPKGIA